MFDSLAYFWGAEFKKPVSFWNAKFKRNVNFNMEKESLFFAKARKKGGL
ncbi:hypothetical protein KC734_08095 [candidate division KSB1 bacterium]|nr:hypothetical protein [candidate division KSB1 bacterium]